jgi:DNA-binding MarR family transcriptional regulator
MDRHLPSEDLDSIFQAMASGTRRTVLETLARGPATVGELAEQLPVTRGAVSQHLKILLQAGLVEVRPSGRERVYHACGQGLARLASCGGRFTQPGVSDSLPVMTPEAQHKTVQEAAPKKARTSNDPVAAGLAKWQSEAKHIDYSVLALMLYFDQIGQSVFKSTSDAAASAGMSYNDLMVLGALRRVGAPYESTLTELSGMFWISLPGMMKRLSRLESLGFLERSHDPGDRRSRRVRLTDKGLLCLRDLVANHQPAEYFALLNLPEQDRGLLFDLLPRLLDDIDRLHNHARPVYVVR